MSKERTHWKELTDAKYIGAYSMVDIEDLVVTIDKVSRQTIKTKDGDQQKIVATLKGQKPMIINTTNCESIEKIYGNVIQDWEGKKITLYKKKIRAFGEFVEALRVREVAPKNPELKPSDKAKWDAAVKAIQGGLAITQIEKKYSLSTVNKKKLEDEGNKSVQSKAK
jgi:hypothetical protein